MAIATGDGEFGIEAVGTAEHQDVLETIAGGRTETGVDHLCGALLVPDPKNPYDPNAIAVVIASHVVGYIPSNIAPSLKYAMRVGGFIAAGCAAKITGGWIHADGDIGDFGVRLDALWPFKLRSIAKQTAPSPPPPPLVAPQRAPPVAAAAPAVAAVPPYGAEDAGDDAGPLPRPRRSIVRTGIELLIIAAILAGGYWWLQRLPRQPQDAAPPVAVTPPAIPEPAPAEPAPPEPTPFVWPDPPPTAAPPPATEPAPAPPVAAPAPPPKKAPAKAKPAAPKTPPPNAPLKLTPNP